MDENRTNTTADPNQKREDAHVTPAAGSAEETQTILAAREGISEQSESMWSIYVRRFRKHTLGKVGLVILLILYLAAVFADFLSPFDMTWTNKYKPYHPRTRIYWISTARSPS